MPGRHAPDIAASASQGPWTWHAAWTRHAAWAWKRNSTVAILALVCLGCTTLGPSHRTDTVPSTQTGGLHPAETASRAEPPGPDALDVARSRVFLLSSSLSSNPSGLAFGGWTAQGQAILFTVCDGSAVVKDQLDPHLVMLRLHVDPTGTRPIEMLPIRLEDGAVSCDLESIEVDPKDGTLWLADERVARLPACGGTGEKGAARSRIVHVSREGALLDGPFETDILNTDNNGIEGMAALREGSDTHLLLFKEWTEEGAPPILRYRVRPGMPPELLAQYQLDRPTLATQSGADIRVQDGILQILDRDMLELLEVELRALDHGPFLPIHRVVSLRRLLEIQCGVVCTILPERRKGMVEGIASDDQGGVWIILDNNGDVFPAGDRSPRLIYLPKGAF